MLEGNVGYVKIDGFRAEDTPQVDGLMTYLRTADAIIIDLQNNGGGAQPVNYLSSYFLPKDTLMSRTYHRSADKWRDHIVEPVAGDKRLDVPLFILINNKTFSAAEAFSYNLQALNRAVVIGEASGGGAHPIQFKPLPHGLATIVPNRRSFNPTTRSNWEAVGVKPDVESLPEKSLETAHQLAKTAAQAFREEGFNELRTALSSQKYSEELQSKVNGIVKKLLYRKHIEPFMIEGFARQYQEQGQRNAAKLLLNFNK